MSHLYTKNLMPVDFDTGCGVFFRFVLGKSCMSHLYTKNLMPVDFDTGYVGFFSCGQLHFLSTLIQVLGLVCVLWWAICFIIL